MKKLLAILLSTILGLGVVGSFAACKDRKPDGGDEIIVSVEGGDDLAADPFDNEAAKTGQTTKPPFQAQDLKSEWGKGAKVTLDMAVFHDGDSYITYNGGSSNNPHTTYAAANGKTYKVGDIKPVWEELSGRLNFDIVDKNFGQTSQANLWTTVKAANFEGFDIITAAGQNINEQSILAGTFEDLAQHLDKMPHLKAFMEGNDVIAQSVYVGDKMYFAPYFDGNDDLERMFMLRVDWVEKLLDGDYVAANFDTGVTITPAYQRFMPDTMNRNFTVVKADGTGTEKVLKKYSKNIIDVQDDLATKNGATLVKALRDYIDSTYNNKYGAKRSELFTGVNAAYDADELVALLRCVKASPKLLTGAADTNIVPFYPRNSSNDRLMDIVRFAQIWGVRGTDSRNNFFFVDENGELKDARMHENTMIGLEKLNQLYKEGLILQNFTQDTAVEGSNFTGDNTFRGRLNQQNRGFMTYDYNQTTTVVNALGDGDSPAIEGFNLTPVLAPFTKWGYTVKNTAEQETVSYTRFTESWRSVKPNGWAIRAGLSADKLNKALELFDYLYSKTGNRLMSYGPEQWIDGTITYNGRQVPKLSAAALDELKNYANNNYTNYYRRFLGGTFPIGYVKEQGMEYQCVHPKGQVGLNNILKAIELGTMTHLVLDTQGVEDSRLYTVPTALPFKTSEQKQITDNCSKLAEYFNVNNAKNVPNLYYDIIANGFGSSAVITKWAGYGYTGTTLTKTDMINFVSNTLKGKAFQNVNNWAYLRALGLLTE